MTRRAPAPRLPDPTTIIRWEDPPPPRRDWRKTVNIRRIRELQTVPGKWALVARTTSQGSANILRQAAERLGVRVEVTTRKNEEGKRWSIYARVLPEDDDSTDDGSDDE